MKFLLCFLLTLSVLPPLSAQEEEPVRRRPRIRVYDQSVNVVPMDTPVERDLSSEQDLERRIRQDTSAPSTFENPVHHVSLLPVLNTGSNGETDDEEEKESWFTPMDFLVEEDRMNGEDLLQAVEEEPETEESGMDITDWRELQKSMIAEAMKKEDPDLTDEEIEELLAAENEESETDAMNSRNSRNAMNGGLELGEISSLPQGRLQEEGASLPDVSSGDLGFVPVLQSRRQRDRELNQPRRERDPRFELSGSRGIMNDMKEKWAKERNSSAPSASQRFEASALPRESLMSRPMREPASFPGFSDANPAVPRPLPAPEPALGGSTPRRENPAPQPRPEQAPPRRDEFRLKSLLGQPPGM